MSFPMSFPQRITNLERNFYLTLEGYKNAYVQKERDDTSENKKNIIHKNHNYLQSSIKSKVGSEGNACHFFGSILFCNKTKLCDRTIYAL